MPVLEIDRSSLPFNAKALSSARALRGLTQVELAERVALSRQQIYNLERGDVKSPPAATVRALAAALQVPVDYLARTPRPPPNRGMLHLRGKKRLSEKIVEQLCSRAEHFGSVVDHVMGLATFGPVSFPSIAVETLDDVEQAAERCRDHWGLGQGPVEHVSRVLERAGAFVGTYSLDEDGIDAFSWMRPRPAVMCNMSKDSPSRVRFSLSHECGHLVIHDGKATGDPVTEGQANRFAGAFLIPRASFFREFPRSTSGRLNWDGMLRMKQNWKVSLAAILHRALDLNLIGADTYRWSQVRLAQLGWKKREPEEPTAADTPELLPKVLRSLAERAKPTGFSRELLEFATGACLPDPASPFSNVFQLLLNEPGPNTKRQP